MHIKQSSEVTESVLQDCKNDLLHLGRNLQSVVDDDVLSSILDGILFLPVYVAIPNCTCH